MPRAQSYQSEPNHHSLAPASLYTDDPGLRHLNCARCQYTLECVERSRRSGAWLGSFICPNCRNEYFYAYQWDRLVRKP